MSVSPVRSQGFTLIELIIVIVILGILAVTAAPKFINISGDARSSVLSAVAGSMKSAAALNNAVALANQNTPGLRGTATGLENGFITKDDVLLDQGYPVALDYDNPGSSLSGDGDGTPEILEAMDLDTEDWTYNVATSETVDGALVRGLYMTSSSEVVANATTAQIKATNCYVGYQSFVLVQRKPVVTVVDSGCN